jgi:DNA replication protein DnaC
MDKAENQVESSARQQLTLGSTMEFKPCPTCNNCEISIYANECYGCQQRAANERTYQMELAQLVGRRFMPYTFDTFPVDVTNEAIYTRAQKASIEENLFIYGPTGTGKTSLALSLLRRHTDSRRSVTGVVFTQPSKIAREVRSCEGAAQERAAITKYAKAALLVLDDFGAEKATDFMVQLLYEIIDRRFMDLRGGMIITSNLPMKDLAMKLGDDRIPSRLVEMCAVLHLNGKDRRFLNKAKG